MTGPAVVTLIGYLNIPPGNAREFRANCEEMIAASLATRRR